MPRNTTTTSSHNIHSNNTNSSSNSYNTINIYQGYHRERALFATFPTVTDFRLLQHARTRCKSSRYPNPYYPCQLLRRYSFIVHDPRCTPSSGAVLEKSKVYAPSTNVFHTAKGRSIPYVPPPSGGRRERSGVQAPPTGALSKNKVPKVQALSTSAFPD